MVKVIACYQKLTTLAEGPICCSYLTGAKRGIAYIVKRKCVLFILSLSKGNLQIQSYLQLC